MSNDKLREYFIQMGKEATDPNAGLKALPVFLSGSRELNTQIYETAIAYLTAQRAKEKGDDRQYTIFNDKYEELRQEHFSDFDEQELTVYLVLFLQYSRRYANRLFNVDIDENLLKESGIHNRLSILNNGQEVVTPLIKAIKPSLDGQTQRNRIRRRHRANYQQHPDTLAVMLYNSFIYVSIKRPSRLAYLRLMNDIEQTLRGFGERWVINPVNLERAGITRKVVDFFIEHIVNHTVENILDKEELKSLILINDIEAICAALLEAGSPNGVYYNLTCLANRCNHSSVKLYDPHDMYVVLYSELTIEQRDFIAQLCNSGLKFSAEEIRKHQNNYQFKGEPVDVTYKLYAEDDIEEKGKPYGEITLAVPTISEYLTTFDLMAETYDPTIKEYATKYVDNKDFRKKRSEFLGAIRMGEYVHWVKNYVTYKEIDVEGAEDIIESRETGSQREFEQGLLDIFSDDDKLYWGVFSKIMETTPYMTHTLFGFANSQCGACGGVAGQEKDQDGKLIPVHSLTKATGFTPIDPIANFFDHTRMQIEEMGQLQRLQEEITS